jgi:hypothetical protein
MSGFDDMYREEILAHYKRPHNWGEMESPDLEFEDVNPLCGDELKVMLRVGEDGTIDLPPAGRVVAEGLTTEALGKRIAESLGRTHAGARVSVTRPGAAGAATQPEENGAGDDEKGAAKGKRPPQGGSTGSSTSPSQESESAAEPLPAPGQQ